jgi:hypothetical protein
MISSGFCWIAARSGTVETPGDIELGSECQMALNIKKELEMPEYDQCLLVRVTDMNTGKPKANIKIPADLANPGMKLRQGLHRSA